MENHNSWLKNHALRILSSQAHPVCAHCLKQNEAIVISFVCSSPSAKLHWGPCCLTSCLFESFELRVQNRRSICSAWILNYHKTLCKKYLPPCILNSIYFSFCSKKKLEHQFFVFFFPTHPGIWIGSIILPG